MRDLFDIRDRVVVLTGARGKLGKVFLRALLGRGARVAALDLKPAARVKSLPKCLNLTVDLTSRSQVQASLRKIVARWGVPHALINNAAVDFPPRTDGPNPSFEKFPEELWRRALDTNLTGAFLTAQVFGSAMARKRSGSVINIGSVYGLLGPDQRIYVGIGSRRFVKPAVYGASKAGLLNLTKYLATYWGSRGVRVNMLTFGGVRGAQSRSFIRNYSARVPLGRMAEAHEYVGALVFLISDASSYMTGSNMILDGGWTAW
jgi:NAD(P)-dependent dehydrogenase (short-subunit alcohol dehydrogenase family)